MARLANSKPAHVGMPAKWVAPRADPPLSLSFEEKVEERNLVPALWLLGRGGRRKSDEDGFDYRRCDGPVRICAGPDSLAAATAITLTRLVRPQFAQSQDNTEPRSEPGRRGKDTQCSREADSSAAVPNAGRADYPAVGDTGFSQSQTLIAGFSLDAKIHGHHR